MTEAQTWTGTLEEYLSVPYSLTQSIEGKIRPSGYPWFPEAWLPSGFERFTLPPAKAIVGRDYSEHPIDNRNKQIALLLGAASGQMKVFEPYYRFLNDQSYIVSTPDDGEWTSGEPLGDRDPDFFLLFPHVIYGNARPYLDAARESLAASGLAAAETADKIEDGYERLMCVVRGQTGWQGLDSQAFSALSRERPAERAWRGMLVEHGRFLSLLNNEANARWPEETCEADNAHGPTEDRRPGLSRSRAVAYSQCMWASRESGFATDRELYAWLTDRLDDEELPQFDTWARYVREARAFHGTQKNTPRSGRTGRNTVRQEDI